MDNKQLREMAKAVLDNGDFDVSGYARIEKAGLEYLAAEGDLEQHDIDYWVKGPEDWDGLCSWAYELAVGMPLLPNSEIYLLKTIDVGQDEPRPQVNTAGPHPLGAGAGGADAGRDGGPDR